jgi:hypothetical protein
MRSGSQRSLLLPGECLGRHIVAIGDTGVRLSITGPVPAA